MNPLFKLNLITLIFAFVASIANAGTGGISGGPKPSAKDINELNPQMSWSELKAQVKLNPSLKFSGDYVFLGKPSSAFKVCVDGEELRSLEKKPVYKSKYVGIHKDNNDSEKDGYVQVQIGYDYERFPIRYETRQVECDAKDKNCKDVYVMVEQNLLKNISLKSIKTRRKSHGDTQETIKKIFDKDFEIPNCSN